MVLLSHQYCMYYEGGTALETYYCTYISENPLWKTKYIDDHTIYIR